MTAWRVRLNRIWNLVIISPAFLEALSMALRRADCSQAWPSARAQKRELASAYSRRLGRTASSTSKEEKLAGLVVSIVAAWNYGVLQIDIPDSLMASSEKASMMVGS